MTNNKALCWVIWHIRTRWLLLYNMMCVLIVARPRKCDWERPNCLRRTSPMSPLRTVYKSPTSLFFGIRILISRDQPWWLWITVRPVTGTLVPRLDRWGVANPVVNAKTLRTFANEGAFVKLPVQYFAMKTRSRCQDTFPRYSQPIRFVSFVFLFSRPQNQDLEHLKGCPRNEVYW
jgi:hypothetical protein